MLCREFTPESAQPLLGLWSYRKVNDLNTTWMLQGQESWGYVDV